MLQPPKVTRFRKKRKGRSTGRKNQSLVYGNVGLMVRDQWKDLTARQIEAARRVISRTIRHSNGKIYIRVFPDYPRTSKPAEVRQGKGKGSIDRYVFRAKPGHIIFEISCENEKIAVDAFEKAAYKLPFSVTILRKQIVEEVNDEVN